MTRDADSLKTISIYDCDPDFRHNVITDGGCWRCNRVLRKGRKTRYFVHIVNGGMEICRAADSAKFEGTAGDCGLYEIGPDCAKKVDQLCGEGWVIKQVESK